MLTFYTNNVILALPIFIMFLSLWRFFISNNYFYYRVKPLSTDLINKTTFFKKLNYSIFIKWNLTLLFLYFLFNFNLKSESVVFFWNHLILTNFKFWLFFILFFISLILYFFFKEVTKNNLPHSIDFFFALANLSIFIPLIFYTNTLYTFIFAIEIVSVLLFYKFAVSKVWFTTNNNTLNQYKNKFAKILPKQFMDVLFFQFWSTFFSTILILLSLLNLFYIFGSSEWVILDLLFNISQETSYFDNNIYFVYLLTPLIFGIFFKLGMTPLHLYKIEVYKGLPFVTIFFYTTFFFLSFVLFFSYFLISLMGFLKNFWFFFLMFFLIVGGFVLGFLLFDAKYVKAFFAYSTVINVVLILLTILIYFNH